MFSKEVFEAAEQADLILRVDAPRQAGEPSSPYALQQRLIEDLIARRDATVTGERYLLSAGVATLDGGALSLTLAARPAHATTVRAYRQALGGEVELAGFSESLTVSFVQFEPLTPGATYSLTVVGHNAQGDGDPSPAVNFLAPT